MEHSLKQRTQEINRVTWWGLIVNLVLAVVKLIGGTIGQSQSLIADGLHSLSDLASDAMVLVAAKHAGEEADDDHPYGHGRFETLATVGLGLLLIVVALGIAYDAAHRVFDEEVQSVPALFTLAVAVFSILCNEGLYHFTHRVGIKINSKMLIANAWHHRSDALSSLAVLARWIRSALDSALCAEAAIALQEELRSLAPAEATDRVFVSSHLLHLNPSPLRGAATVVRNGCDITDHRNLHASGLKRPQRGLATASRTLHIDAEGTNAVFLRLLRTCFGGDLSSKGRRFLRPLEARLTAARPGDSVSADVGNRDDRVVEGRMNMSNTRLDILLDLLFRFLGNHMDLSHHVFGASFLPAIVFAGPFRVRAFVWVLCPRTGSPRRWRSPR